MATNQYAFLSLPRRGADRGADTSQMRVARENESFLSLRRRGAGICQMRVARENRIIFYPSEGEAQVEAQMRVARGKQIIVSTNQDALLSLQTSTAYTCNNKALLRKGKST